MRSLKPLFRRVPGTLASLALVALLTMPAASAAVGHLKVTVGGVTPGGIVPDKLAFCVPNGKGQAKLGPNRNPSIAWSSGPDGTKSYAIIVHDSDVPSVGKNVNRKGVTISASLPRVNFYHWVLVDIPTNVHHIPYGAVSRGVTPHGKPAGHAHYGVRGINSYTQWFAHNPKMKGNYGGYDGPCPPWNDTIAHHYHFTVYALDVSQLSLAAHFTGPDALNAMRGHVLARGSVVGLYSVNPRVLRKLRAQQ